MEKRGKRRIWLVTAGLFLALLILLVLSLVLGSVGVNLTDIPELLFGKGDPLQVRILRELRLPRALMALLLGGALALSGLMLQVFFENPIAGPFVLGISSGAKLTVAIAMILCLKQGIALSSAGMIIAAFAGAGGSLLLLLMVSRRLPSGTSLLVAGIMIGYICSAVTELFINLADDQNVVSLHSWSMGSFSGTKWEEVLIAAAVILPVFILSLFLAKPMQAYFLGESIAASLGVSVRVFRIILILSASFLAATVTAFAGPVSFVGIAVPFLIRKLSGTERPKVTVPLSFLGGAVFCLGADLLARLILQPTELSISVVTSILGAPVVIALLLIRERGHGK